LEKASLGQGSANFIDCISTSNWWESRPARQRTRAASLV